MDPALRNTAAAALAGLLCIACTTSTAKGKAPAATYPAVLQGIWEGGEPGCKLPGNPDSDVRLNIAAGKITAYEDWSAPQSVVQISKTPQAWKIVSQLHINDDSLRVEEIFVLSGEDRGALTIVNAQQAHTYYRCR